MYRLYGALAVILSAVVLIAAGYVLNTRTADRLLSALDESYTLAEAGDISSARERILSAKKELDNRLELMLLFVSHGRLDEIEETVNKACEYIEHDELSLFMAECSTAILMTEHFINVENPYISNIF